MWASKCRLSSADMPLSDFLGQELLANLARLNSSRLFGAWDGGNPVEKRRRTCFAPMLYGEDHPRQEICLLLTGRCRFSFRNRVSELKAGDMVACAGHVQHADAFCASRDNYRLVRWLLDEKDPMLHVRRYRRRGGYDREYDIRLGTLATYGKERLDVLRALTARSVRQKPGIEALREGMLSVILELYRQVLPSGQTPIDSRAELARKVTEFVRAHSLEALALADVARAFDMSPNYLTSLFHSQTGISLGRFIRKERIALAQHMLRKPMASVKSVGIDLGFPDPFTFSRAFKRISGTAPRTWLQSQLGVQASAA
jgi:AraC-like DNA-binding protein